MKEKISFKKCFDLDKFIFHPDVYYPGEWFLNSSNFFVDKDVLAMNQIGNRYDIFLQNNYYNVLPELLKNQSVVIDFPVIVSRIDEVSQSRGLYFDLDSFLLRLMRTSLLNSRDKLNELCTKYAELSTYEDKIRFINSILSEDCKKYRDIINKGNNSEYYYAAREAFDLYNAIHGNNGISFENFYKNYTKDTLVIKSSLHKIVPFFRKEIDYKSFIECFDYDKLSLLVSYSLLDTSLEAKNSTGELGNTINYLSYYAAAVEKLKENKINYNKKVEIFNIESFKFETITTKELLEKFYKIKNEYCNMPFSEVSLDELKEILESFGYVDVDLSTKEGYNIVSGIIKKLRKDKLLAADWIFIPNDETNNNHKKRIANTTSGNNSTYEEKVKYVNKCKEFLDSTKYLYKIYGRNEFTGYIGYIYSSGYVIFEKFDLGRTTARHATYIMEYTHFLQNSKYNKRELISKIKSGEITGVYREFHNSDDFENWKNKITKYISSFEYTNQVMDYIDIVLSTSVIRKDDTKKLIK